MSGGEKKGIYIRLKFAWIEMYGNWIETRTWRIKKKKKNDIPIKYLNKPIIRKPLETVCD